MNRLKSYFDSARMVKLYLVQADEDAHKGKQDRAIHNITQAVRCLLTAMNNVASIGFNQKPRRKNHVKKSPAVSRKPDVGPDQDQGFTSV